MRGGGCLVGVSSLSCVLGGVVSGAGAEGEAGHQKRPAREVGGTVLSAHPGETDTGFCWRYLRFKRNE